jgi:hypothetical protein
MARARRRRGASDRLRIGVMGLLVRIPLGGMAWHYLNYVLGLRSLGHDVVYIEDSDDYPACYDPSRYTSDVDPSYGLAFVRATLAPYGLGEAWGYYDAHARRWHGSVGAATVADLDMLINVSHLNPLREWALCVPARVAIDTDPAFTQIRNATDAPWRARVALHTHFFTFGERIGQAGVSVPDDGFPWVPTRQPVALDVWPMSAEPHNGRMTTVMQWDAYPPREFAGHRYGMKSDAFAPYFALPDQVSAPLEIALGSPEAPRDRLAAHGWHLRDPLAVTATSDSYRAYVRSSKAEFSVSKHGYVTSGCGWFSERSTNYLASGRPVIVQDTGFSKVLPTGAGLLTFTNPDEAVTAIEDVVSDYARHRRHAREVAAAHFGADVVLPPLLAQAQS